MAESPGWPRAIQSGEKNQCNSRKDRHALSSGPSVSISSSTPPLWFPALKCGTRELGNSTAQESLNKNEGHYTGLLDLRCPLG